MGNEIKVTPSTNTWAFCMIALGREPLPGTVQAIAREVFISFNNTDEEILRNVLKVGNISNRERDELKDVLDVAEYCSYVLTVSQERNTADYIAVLTGRIQSYDFVRKLKQEIRDE